MTQDKNKSSSPNGGAAANSSTSGQGSNPTDVTSAK